ncbi:neuron navigator 3-like isoform X4 [Saccostrea cucullata]|uniref:neuron navigator 3-like isoform X4 n=1 Tax=Saccostrea cuccullata TaxID=36930 RepID=UPI002ED5B28B
MSQKTKIPVSRSEKSKSGQSGPVSTSATRRNTPGRTRMSERFTTTSYLSGTTKLASKDGDPKSSTTTKTSAGSRQTGSGTKVTSAGSKVVSGKVSGGKVSGGKVSSASRIDKLSPISDKSPTESKADSDQSPVNDDENSPMETGEKDLVADPMSTSLVKKHDSGIESDGSNMDKSEIFMESDFIDTPVSKSSRVSKICESLISFSSMDSGNYDGVSATVDDNLGFETTASSTSASNSVSTSAESKSDVSVISVVEIPGGDLEEQLKEKVPVDKMPSLAIEDKVSKIASVDVQIQGKVKIYTDWANHYLEKAKNKHTISDLQQDVSDGVLLAEVIEAVTNDKIKDIKSKPKSTAQMVDNINKCLAFLAGLGVNIEGLCAKDIRDGNLKSILGLFYSLSRYQQQQKAKLRQGQEPAKAQPGESTPDNHHLTQQGRHTPQLNGGESLSRLPSPFNKGSKCPTITNPSSKESGSHSNSNLNNARSSRSTPTSSDRNKAQLNQQNNNVTSGSSFISAKNNVNNNPVPSASQRATSPGSSATSGIPIPGGRSLAHPRSGDKSGGRVVSTGSTTSTSSSASGKSTSQKAPATTNKNSMLDKFKFFNSKDKSKTKSSLPKSASKQSTTSTGSTCSSSDRDSRASDRQSSASARSSSSTDPGTCGSSTPSNDSGSPKLPPKTKSLSKGGFSGREKGGSILTAEDVSSKHRGSPSPTPTSHSSTLPASNKKSSAKSDKHDKSGQKSSKIGTLIPKSSSSSSGGKSKSPSSAPSSGIPTPSSSIPKPSSSGNKSVKSSKEDLKSSKEEKSKSRNSNSSGSAQKLNVPLPATPTSNIPSVRSMQSHPSQIPGCATLPSSSSHNNSHLQHGLHQSKEHSDQSKSRDHHSHSKTLDPRMQHQEKSRYTEVEYTDGRLERVGEGHSSKPSQLPLNNKRLPAPLNSNTQHHETGLHNNAQSVARNSGSSAAAESNHIISASSQTINVVKPTCSVATPSNVLTKSDGNTQTNLSVLNRALPPPLPKTEPPPRSVPRDNSNQSIDSNSASTSASGHNSDSTPSSSSNSGKSGHSHSSSESVIYKPSSGEEFSGSEKGSATNSPHLGLKVLHSQLNKTANNVAIVQPRHGEKVETTFDTEVRTEKVIKDSKETTVTTKETTFSEKTTTFVDDEGEKLDIKPMAPITRAMSYGSSGLLRGYGSPGNKLPVLNYHNPGYATPTPAYFASTSRLGVNRPLIDHGKFYSGPIRKVPSSGQNSGFDTDYSSDYDTYDYMSGYMSDGDILKNQGKMEDMTSGYLSEGGASLYARRLQQRFREGMQAVKECMQKSSGLLDDDSFDDSSSISSGDISDTINEISTDDGNLTGGSGQSDQNNPYNSIKRIANARGIPNGYPGHMQGKRAPNLGTSAFMGAEYSSDASHMSGWRKYSLPQTNRLLSSDPADYAYLFNGYSHASPMQQQWGTPPVQGQMRKLSNTSQPDINHYRTHSADYVDPSKSGVYSSSNSLSNKKDSETNTDQSHLMEASMRRVQQGGMGPGGQGGFGYRRPLSNTSTGSAGSNKSNGSGSSCSKSSTVGSRLAKHGVMNDSNGIKSGENTPSGIPRPGSATSIRTTPQRTEELFTSATLERKRKGINGARTNGNNISPPEELYKSNTLGRTQKKYGSKTSLTRTPSQGENTTVCNNTIISNPHATYGKNENGRPNMYSQSLPNMPQNGAPGNYVAMEYGSGSPRNSGSGQGIWLKNTNGNAPMHMSETESMDSISSHASSIQAQIQQARALSDASARILAHGMNNVGLSRSNSLKSTQSDSVFGSNAGDNLTRTNSFSQLPSPPPPSSPTPSNSSHSSRFTYPMTAFGGGSMSAGGGYANPASLNQNMVRSNTQSSLPPYGSLAHSKMNRDEDGSIHGSNLSLASCTSSIYSTAEEKQQHEIRKLRRELEAAQEKVVTLTTQLSTNAHVVAAFEQSLTNMTARLQHLTSTAEQKASDKVRLRSKQEKDSELNELRATIEALKRQSGLSIPDPTILSPGAGRRHTSPEGRITRQLSTDSVSSINSLSSACSTASQQSAATDGEAGRRKKKKGWLRSSFSKAFSRKKNKSGSMSDCEVEVGQMRSNFSAPNSPLLQIHMPNGQGLIKGSHSSSALYEAEDATSVLELRKQLRDKDMKLTDIRLEALSSAHQLEQLRETMNKMKNEMSALKADNDRLQRMMHVRPLNSSQNSIVHNRTSSESLERSLSITEQPSLEMILSETPDRDGKRVTMTVYLGSNPDPLREGVEKPAEVLIGSLSVSGKTKWDILDNIVRKILKEYVLRVDPVTNLGLSAESVFSYHIAEIVRTKDAELPELLPIGYLVGDTMQIGICLKGTRQNSVDSLAFETLIPKSIVQRYVSLLLEHRRIILCGPSGTGKTYLAQKLAEHLVLRSGKELTAGSVATFNVDHKSAKELRQYLANIAEQCENTGVGELPSVIILDNLHHVGSLGEVFNGFLSVKYQKCPYIIGTMNQATCSTTNLQLHHNFRWVLCANHMEPVKGFLGRYLRRKLVEAEVRTGIRNNDLNKIIDWVPKVWLHLNKFLETHSSSDVTIGPRLFLSCPMEIAGSKVWFTDLWNYSIVPYLLEAVREGLQVYGKRAPWEDPTDWVLESYPWATAKDEDPSLLKIRPEDVGYDSQGVISTSSGVPLKSKSADSANHGESTTDPLYNMIKRLQEAANYSSSQSGQDEDSASVGSRSSSVQDLSTSSVESTI